MKSLAEILGVVGWSLVGAASVAALAAWCGFIFHVIARLYWFGWSFV